MGEQSDLPVDGDQPDKQLPSFEYMNSLIRFFLFEIKNYKNKNKKSKDMKYNYTKKCTTFVSANKPRPTSAFSVFAL